jgi:predicted nucleic acid-binding protein
VIRYFDASALVKRYAQEAGSRLVRSLLEEGPAASSRLSEIEVASALVRRCREGSLSSEERDRALTALRKDCASLYLVELTAEVAVLAIALLLRYRLRANDATQLAACLHLAQQAGQPVELVVFDRRLIEAAKREGLPVVGG